MMHLLSYFLAGLSRRILKKYAPAVIGITGTVGKTSTRDAVATVLGSRLIVRASTKNYNNEIGVPLTIIGIAKSPGKSLMGWIRVFFQALRLLFIHDVSYPRILIIEMGADRKGDIAYLTHMAPCTIGIITAISPVHIEKFGSMDVLEREKKEMFRHLHGPERWAFVNLDDPILAKEVDRIDASVLTYGEHVDADVRAVSVKETLDFTKKKAHIGLSFGLLYKQEQVPVSLPGHIGRQTLSCALVAACCGITHGMSLTDIAQQLSLYVSPHGRMRGMDGINDSLLIDDTYNASSQAAYVALDALTAFRIASGARRIAILGDMLELGQLSKELHEQVGAYCVKKGIDMLIAIGEHARSLVDGARASGLDEQAILWFHDAIVATKSIPEHIHSGDVVLVKGSQGVRLEKVVAVLLKDSSRAHELLVRQEKEWK